MLRTHTANKNRGFSLIEVIITAAIFSIIMYGVMSALMSTQDAFIMSVNISTTDAALRRAFDGMDLDFKTCRVVSVSDDHSQIRIQIPVDWDGDGDRVDADCNAEWGAYDDLGVHRLGYSVVYKLTSLNVVNEQFHNVDYNKDNDRTDLLDCCRLTREIRNATDGLVSQQSVTRDVYVAYNDYDGDVNGDGQRPFLCAHDGLTHTGDPLFLRVNNAGDEDNITGYAVDCTLYLIRLDSMNRPTIVGSRHRFALRNPQE